MQELTGIRRKYFTLKKHLPISSFVFVLESNDSVTLPFYSGSTFRGSFGVSLKRVTCTLLRINSLNKKPMPGKEVDTVKNDCMICIFKSSCLYMKIFETYVDKAETPLKKVHTALHPYILEPPFNSTLHVYTKGEEVKVGINLIGLYIDDLPYFIAAFSEFEKIGIGKGRGHLSLKSVFYKFDVESKPTLVYDGNRGLLYNPNVKDPSYFNRRLIKKILEEKILTIKFLTPARIVHNKQLTRDLTFFIFLKNLLRRINQLSFFYSVDGKSLQEKGFDIMELLEESKGIEVKDNNLYWLDWKRYSKRQGRRMTLGGFMGDIVFEGDFSKFIPFLFLGENSHVGKNTAFGLGKYLIE